MKKTYTIPSLEILTIQTNQLCESSPFSISSNRKSGSEGLSDEDYMIMEEDEKK